MVIFTSDIDWAPDAVIDDTVKLFTEHQTHCTFFATHKTPALEHLNENLFEIGLHLNFTSLLSGSSSRSADSILTELVENFPEAKGVRSHALVHSSGLLELFRRHGMLYESNHLMPYFAGLSPYLLWNGLLSIPYNWEDDVHWAFERSFDDCGIEILTNKLVILDFHPIHLFLNTDSQSTYDRAKPYYQHPEKLIEYRNTTRPGAYSLCRQLLHKIRENRIPTCRLIDLYNNIYQEKLLCQ